MDKQVEKIIIYNKFYDLNKDKTYFYNNKDSFNVDRLSSTIDDVLDKHIFVKNRFIKFLMNYFFYNNDYKKNRSFSSRKTNIFKLINTLIWIISIVGLVICLFFGIALPVFNSTTDTLQLLQGKYLGSVDANNQIIGWVINQSNVISLSNDIINKLKDVTSYQEFLQINDLQWLRYFIEKYWAIKFNFNDYFEALVHLKEYLITHTFTEFQFIDFNLNFQVLVYFKLVNQSLLSSELHSVLSSFDINKLEFLNLNANNIFYNLHLESICLSNDKASQALLVSKIWSAWFHQTSVITPLCFTLLFLFIIFFNRYVIKKSKNKYYSMSMFDFLSYKLRFLSKFRWFLNKPVFISKNISQLQHNVFYNFDAFDKTSFYNSLRLLNYAYSVVESLDFVLICNYDENLKQNLESIINNECSNLAIEIVSYNKINEWLTNDNVNDKELKLSQYENYIINYLELSSDLINLNKIKELNLIKKLKNISIHDIDENELVDNIVSDNRYKKLNIKNQFNKGFDNFKIALKTRNFKIINILMRLEKYEKNKVK